MNALTAKELNIIRGKNLVGAAAKEDILRMFQHIDALEDLLDFGDQHDAFGTEGWRRRLGIDE